jgi:hypothetical protein
VFFALGRLHAAWSLVFAAVAVLLVRGVDPPRRFDLAVVIAMAFNGWGDALHLFSRFSWYDNLVHVTLPLALGVTGAAAYEIYEFAVDAFLGQHLFISESDTANDLFDGFVGAGIGGLLLASLARSGMPVRRGAMGTPVEDGDAA